MEKTIAVLGATGSVGTQALDVAAKRGFKVDFFSVNKSVDEAERLARLHSPRALAAADEASARELKTRLSDTDIRVLSGEEGILEGIASSSAETVVNSIIGEAGLLPSLAVIDSGKRLALANKESLVIAGEAVMGRARDKGVEIIPVDSEHSAIFQSLKSGKQSEIKKIILTASGGPFFGKSREELARVTRADTLAHPTWKMGAKITVDSATLMNKGFEVIEACHLFGVSSDKIEVCVHRESILHSAVEYIDNTVIGEFSVPDMRMCIQYAVDYPNRCEATSDELDLFRTARLTFAKPDEESFPLLPLAKYAMKCGGAVPATLNAADEVAVTAFLAEKISFLEITEVVSGVVSELESYASSVSPLDIPAIIEADRAARRLAGEYLSR